MTRSRTSGKYARIVDILSRQRSTAGTIQTSVTCWKMVGRNRHSSSDLPHGKHTGASNSKHMFPWTTLL